MTTAVKERSVIFSGEEVRATLARTKTQFRRPVKPQPCFDPAHRSVDPPREPHRWFSWWAGNHTQGIYHRAECHFGVRGDRLIVKECWRVWKWSDPHIEYKAGGVAHEGDERCYAISEPCSISETKRAEIEMTTGQQHAPSWRSSTHMPRWASRLTLEVKDVRVERVQDISKEDALASGIPTEPFDCMINGEVGTFYPIDPSYTFAIVWNSVAKPGFEFSANPWTWIVDYAIVEEK